MKNHANIAADHSTATTLAVDTLRSRKRPSGIKGDGTRASMTRNSANNAAAAPSSTRVWVELHPATLPSTMAYTASINEDVTVAAPARSSRTPSAAPRLAGNHATHIA